MKFLGELFGKAANAAGRASKALKATRPVKALKASRAAKNGLEFSGDPSLGKVAK